MAGTTLRSAQNSYSSSISGGTVPSALKITEYPRWANAVERWTTPFLDMIGKGSPYDLDELRWGQSTHPAHKTTLQTGIDASTGTVVVAAGDGVLLQKYSTAFIYDLIVGSSPARYDYATKEEIWLTADPSTDTCTALRAMGGTTGVAHAAGALIEVGPPVVPQGQDFTISPVKRGYDYVNYFETVAGGIRMSMDFENTRTYESAGNQLVKDMTNEQVRLRILLQKHVIAGGKQAGVVGTPTPSLMGGFLSFITTNVYNQGGAALSVPALDTALTDMWNKLEASRAKKLLMNMNTAQIFDTFLNPYRQATMGDSTGTFVMDRVKLRSGLYDIGVTFDMPDGVIAIADPSEIELVPFKGMDWQTKDHATDGAYKWRSMFGKFSLRVEREATMGLITGFNTDLQQYSGRTFLT